MKTVIIDGVRRSYNVFGNDRTYLKLSERAKRSYADSTLKVCEYRKAGCFCYDIYDGSFSCYDLVAEELSAREVDKFLRVGEYA